MFAGLAAFFHVIAAVFEGKSMLEWAKQHPYATGGIVFIGGLAVWFLFLRGGSASASASADPGTANMAAAYYAAESAQTVAGTQALLATTQANAQVAGLQIQANAAQGIAHTQADMTTTLGQQNADVQNHLADTGLLATQSNNAAAAIAGNFAYQTQLGANQTSLLTTAMNTIIPQEIAATGGWGITATPFGTFDFQGATSPSQFASAGYTAVQIAKIFG